MKRTQHGPMAVVFRFSNRLFFATFLASALLSLNVQAGGSITPAEAFVPRVASEAQLKNAEELKHLLAGIETLQGRFKQSVKDKNGKSLQDSEGSYRIKRPGYFWWETDEPYPQLVVGTPSTLSVYDPDLEQLTVRPQDKNPDSPSQLLSGDFSGFSEQFVVDKHDSSQQVYTLLPKFENSDYQSITLAFENQLPKTLVFRDRLNQSTEVRFVAPEANKPITAKSFLFEAPEGTDIIEEG